MTVRGLSVGVVALAAALAVRPTEGVAAPSFCAPEYYQIELVSTKRVPGTARSSGMGAVTFAASPFSISLGTDGSYQYDVTLDFVRLPEPTEGVYAVWFTTTELDDVIPLGALHAEREMKGTIAWNRFIVVVSLEPSEADIGARWSGPIVMRGMSRSGKMHTMAGHGPFQQENCATYGY
jgi:hypothetical protein